MSRLKRDLSLLWRGIKNYLTDRPLCVSFEVTYACNARCQHCHLGGPVANEKRASAQEFGRISDWLKPVGAQISGGEPLLRSDLEEIIRAIHRPQKPPFIIVTTNGALLNRKRYESLRQAGVDEFSLSLDYPDERHDTFRGIPGLFRKIESLVKELAPLDEKAITLSCVIQNDNFPDLVRLAELARRWGVRINFSTYTWMRTHNRQFMISPDNLKLFKNVLNQLLEFKKKYGTIYTSDYVFRLMPIYFEKGEIGHCRAGQRFFIVNPDGRLSPCGLILKYYSSLDELKAFRQTNSCGYCYTSIRAGTERPPKYLLLDNIRLFRKKKRK
ncbi:MAG: radical SAM protein [Candidatus Aminicenantes bacterium]|nr:radical SAM protein [Candidatus Aminicenantes bacterium]